MNALQTSNTYTKIIRYREVFITALNATVYIDEWQDDIDRVRIYDSNKEYITYIEPDTVIECAESDNVTPEQWLEEEAKDWQNSTDICELMEKIGLDSFTWATKDDLSPIIDELVKAYDSYEIDNKLALMSNEDKLKYILDTEWANVIGNYVVLDTENLI